ncbi:MAG TPA: ABC transporter permease [Anaerolineae bacterium]|nr:ABC transporter permease [Anaerolineae bacterium]
MLEEGSKVSTREKLRTYLLHRWVHRRWFYTHWDLFIQQPLGRLGLIMIFIFGLMALSHPILMKTLWHPTIFDPFVGFDTAIMPHPTTPSWRHLLGTDNFGRDVLSQLLISTQTSFSVGIIAAIIAVTISTLLGGMAGYFGGVIDAIIMGISDVFVLLPAPILLLIFGLLFRLEWPMVAIAYGIVTGLGGQTIVVKSHTLKIKVKPFIEAARAAGGGGGHIIRKHILPGLLSLTIVHAVFTVVGAVLTESLLSYFGRTRYYLSWGTMIWIGQQTFRWFTLEGQWHVILPPALAIMLFCSAFYLVGRALDEVFNPQLRVR